jgi:hypothetical protein
MSVKNFYPELPDTTYIKTVITMPEVVSFAKTLKSKYTTDALAMAYAIFRNESANGTRGVNNNYAGIQADDARWQNLPGQPVATTLKVDSGKALRRFLCFDASDGYKISFELLCIKVTERQMTTAHDYFKKWVGNENQPDQAVKNFQSMLSQGKRIFS